MQTQWQSETPRVRAELPGEWIKDIQTCPIDGGPLVKWRFAAEHRASDDRTFWDNPPPPNHLQGRTTDRRLVSRRQQIRHAIFKVVHPEGAWPDRDRPARIQTDRDIFISLLSAREVGKWLWRSGRTDLQPPPPRGLRAGFSNRPDPAAAAFRIVGEQHLRALLPRFEETAAVSPADEAIGEQTRRMTLAAMDGDDTAPPVTFWREPGWPEAPRSEWRRTLTLVFSQLDGVPIR